MEVASTNVICVREALPQRPPYPSENVDFEMSCTLILAPCDVSRFQIDGRY
jgi:hypothetical protein